MKFEVLIIFVMLSVGAMQGLVLAIGLFTKSKSFGYRKSNQILALLMITIALECIRLIVLRSGIYVVNQGFTVLVVTHAQAVGPLLFLFSQCRVDPDKEFSRIQYLLFVPYAIELGSYVVLFSRLEGLEGDEFYQEMLKWQLGDPAFFHDIFSVSSIFIYLGISYFKLFSSNAKLKNDKWIKRLFLLITINAAYLAILIPVDYFIFDYNLDPTFYRVSTFLQILLVYFVGYTHWMYKPADVSLSQLKNYLNKFSEEDSRRLKELKIQIDFYMRSNEVYLDPNITHTLLAERMEISPKALSEIINRGFGKNFFDFVNDYRVEYVKRQMQQLGEDIQMMQVALGAGFSSKTTFNRAFKKATGVTPTQFNKSVHQREGSSDT